MKNLSFALVGLSILFVIACTDNEPRELGEHVPELPETPFNYTKVMDDVEDFRLPESFEVSGINDPIFTGTTNGSTFHQEITDDAIATLGRVLFYDDRMSKNNSISCASCHKQADAFADGSSVSQGFGGEMTTRNSMTIANPILNRTFFWDGRTRSLRDLALQPVFNHVEMGMDNSYELITKLEKESYYPELFRAAFGSTHITEDRISDALGQFVASIFTDDSKFDEGLEDEFAAFTELEKHGMALFFSDRAQCASCHNGINFASPTAQTFSNPYTQTSGTTNIGLDVVYEDQGFADGKFKIPSLRNIELTGPYMHDGRFETLRDVLNHYNEGIQPHEDLDVKLSANGTPVRLGLTDLDLDALEAFLKTLTGKSMLTDEKYSNPFRT